MNKKQNQKPQFYDTDFIPVQSSRVDSIKYDGESETLYVIFKGGKQYSYEDVSIGEYQSLMSSESIRKAMQEVLNSHKCNKL